MKETFEPLKCIHLKLYAKASFTLVTGTSRRRLFPLHRIFGRERLRGLIDQGPETTSAPPPSLKNSNPKYVLILDKTQKNNNGKKYKKQKLLEKGLNEIAYTFYIGDRTGGTELSEREKVGCLFVCLSGRVLFGGSLEGTQTYFLLIFNVVSFVIF